MMVFTTGISTLLFLASGLSAALPAPAPSTGSAVAAAEGLPPSIVLDAGHGGKDFGAVVHGRYEKTITLAIVRKLKKKLESSGAVVQLTRDSDAYLPLDRRVLESLRGEAFVSVHLNDLHDRRMKGFTVYAYGKSGQRWKRLFRSILPLPAPPKEEIQESVQFASAMVETLRKRGFAVTAPERAEYYVLKNPTMPSILVEAGCLSNPQEAKRLIDPAYQDRIAEGLAAGIRDFLKQKPISIASSSQK